MANSENEKRKRAQRTREFLDQLRERYPNCFTRDPDAIRPLTVGIQHTLRAALAEDEAFKETPNWLLRQALAFYTRSGPYLRAVVEGRPRIDLDGREVGEVTEQQRDHAKAQLEQLKQRRAARRPAPDAKARRPHKPRRPRMSAEERTQRKLDALVKKFAK